MALFDSTAGWGSRIFSACHNSKLRPAPPKLFRVEYREPDVTPFPTGEQVLRWTAAELELVDQTIGVSLGADGQDTSASGLRREDVLEFERFAARDRGAWVP